VPNMNADNISEEMITEQETSKSEAKRQMLALQVLGEKVVALPDAQLNNIPLDEKLRDAILLARKITKRGGLKRQLQYIGKLMRHVDPKPIEMAIEDIEKGHQEANRLFHQREQWRDQLLTGDNDKVTEFIHQFPDTDMQRLRQLLRNHKTAKTDDKKKQIAKLLFQLVSEQVKEM